MRTLSNYIRIGKHIIDKHGSMICTIGSIVTSALSLYMMYKEAPKAQRAIADAENEKWLKYSQEHGPEDGVPYVPLTPMEKFKVSVPYISKPVLVNGVSIAFSIGGHVRAARAVADVTTLLNNALTKNEIIMKTIESDVSPEKFEKIKRDIAEQKVQDKIANIPKDIRDDGLYSFFEPITGQHFRATTEIIRQGCLDFNDILMNSDRGTLSDLMMCWMNKGAKGLTLSSVSDGWFWIASHEKDWLKISSFSPISNDYGNPVSMINYNRDPKYR